MSAYERVPIAAPPAAVVSRYSELGDIADDFTAVLRALTTDARDSFNAR
jgi:hypothetical protein